MRGRFSQDRWFLAGAKEFDNQRFFEAHELWERLWRRMEQPERGILQGLIQLAAACHHLQRGNLLGAKRVFESAQGYLKKHPASSFGIDRDLLLQKVALALEKPESLSSISFEGVISEA